MRLLRRIHSGRKPVWIVVLLCGGLWLVEGGILAQGGKQTAEETPRVVDPRLVVELFAAAPDIVHPISVDFDSKGRMLVIESHTHFRPKDYQGPKHDRIRILEDTDGDGKADRFSTF